ncbi:DUF1343 domain-containing protein [Bdellovibrionota bacterium FG-2]
MSLKRLKTCVATGAFLFCLLFLGNLANAAPVTLGVDVLLDEQIDLIAGKRVALMTHPASVDGNLKPVLDRLFADKRFKLTQLYSPEHGIRGELSNGETSPISTEPRTGLPHEGLFGAHRQPTPKSLTRMDVIVFDLQDIGSRSYTYVSTLGEMLHTCHDSGIPLIVTDRPNPAGGFIFEGPVRDEKYQSLISWGPLSITHGMTMGEVARYYNDKLNIGCKLTVVPMKGWARSMVWEQTGLGWIPPSTGIPHPVNARLYATTALVGGVTLNINEGIGTSLPFEIVGAEFVSSKALAENLNARKLPGVFFREYLYSPMAAAYEDKRLEGVHVMVTDDQVYRPIHTAIHILDAFFSLYGSKLKVGDPKRFGRVWGNDTVLDMLKKGKHADEIEASWQAGLEDFAVDRQKALIY